MITLRKLRVEILYTISLSSNTLNFIIYRTIYRTIYVLGWQVASILHFYIDPWLPRTDVINLRISYSIKIASLSFSYEVLSNLVERYSKQTLSLGRALTWCFIEFALMYAKGSNFFFLYLSLVHRGIIFFFIFFFFFRSRVLNSILWSWFSLSTFFVQLLRAIHNTRYIPTKLIQVYLKRLFEAWSIYTYGCYILYIYIFILCLYFCCFVCNVRNSIRIYFKNIYLWRGCKKYSYYNINKNFL